MTAPGEMTAPEEMTAPGEMTAFESRLARRISLAEVRMVAAEVSGVPERLEALWRLAGSVDRRVSVNALWTMTHLPAADAAWLMSIRDGLTDMLLAETDTSRRRILLQLLRDQEYRPDRIRTDLLDFCMSKINSECEPYAVRCFSIYLAYKMCRHFPELLAELSQHLDMLQLQPLSPGLKSALRQTRRKIKASARR